MTLDRLALRRWVTDEIAGELCACVVKGLGNIDGVFSSVVETSAS